MTEQKYYDALTQQEVTEDFIKAQYEELTSKGDYFHDTYENFKNNNFKKIDTEAISWEQQRIECCYDALDDIEQRIKEHVQEHKAKDHKQEVLELEYTAVVELMRHLSDERKAGGRK